MVTLKETIKKITGLDQDYMKKAQKRLDSLTKPQGSLGRLEELAKQIVGITGKEIPQIKNKVIFTLAGDHGVVEENVSAYPKEVTPQMVYNFLGGGAGINVLANHIGARIIVVDMGVAEKLNPRFNRGQNLKLKSENFKDKKINFGTRNFTKGPAMKKGDAIRSIEVGIEVFEDEMLKNRIDIVGTGDMGIGNTTSSSAIASVLTGRRVEDVTGRGTGIDDELLRNKIDVIKKAIRVNMPDPKDPIDVLSKLGGFEIGGIAGIIIGAASKRVPVVIDGFISGAGALIAYHLQPKVKDFLIAGHCSLERGHIIILEHLGIKPILDLEMRLGEGTGACLAMNIVEASVKIMTQMATFKTAKVSERLN